MSTSSTPPSLPEPTVASQTTPTSASSSPPTDANNHSPSAPPDASPPHKTYIPPHVLAATTAEPFDRPWLWMLELPAHMDPERRELFAAQHEVGRRYRAAKAANASPTVLALLSQRLPTLAVTMKVLHATGEWASSPERAPGCPPAAAFQATAPIQTPLPNDAASRSSPRGKRPFVAPASFPSPAPRPSADVATTAVPPTPASVASQCLRAAFALLRTSDAKKEERRREMEERRPSRDDHPRGFDVAAGGLQGEKFREYPLKYARVLRGRPLLYHSSGVACLGDYVLGWAQGLLAIQQIHTGFTSLMLNPALAGSDDSRRASIALTQSAILILSASLFAVLGSLLSAHLSEEHGRRFVMRWGGVVFIVGAILQCVAPSLAVLVVGRAIQGLGSGLVSAVVPVYQAEISPSGGRGVLAGFEALATNLGYCNAVLFTAATLDKSEMSWRLGYLVQICGAFVFVLVVSTIPESPRWLAKKFMYRHALRVLADLSVKGDIFAADVQHKFWAIIDGLNGDVEKLKKGRRGRSKWTIIVFDYYRRSGIAVSSRIFSQLMGGGAILHFMAERFVQTGLSEEHAMVATGLTALFNCLGALPAIVCVDYFGRRTILLYGSGAICASLILTGLFTTYGNEWSPAHLGGSKGLFAGLALYLFSYGCSWGPIPWLMSAELFPLTVRSRGMALATATDWLFESIGALTAPLLYDALEGRFFFLLAVMALLPVYFVHYKYKETGNRSLESMGSMFNDNVPDTMEEDLFTTRSKAAEKGGDAAARAERAAFERLYKERAEIMRKRRVYFRTRSTWWEMVLLDHFGIMPYWFRMEQEDAARHDAELSAVV
ncbi:General substrate transporter [Mycena kentingensis (nom. inval.)]|nr:General substrate transporter [Mycena kentingensis (nom. inval.)]